MTGRRARRRTAAPVRLSAAAAVAAALLAGCASVREEASMIFPQNEGLVARLRSPNTAATGAVRVYDFRDGVALQLTIANLLPGSYRIALHERDNCTSPNLFSAGGAWAPAGWTKAPGELLPAFTTNPDGDMNGYVAYIRGVRTEGPQSIRGRSVVIHWGNLVGEAFPGQPNNRVACGVFVASPPIF